MKRILIVEDEPIIAMDLSQMVAALDFVATEVVSSGRQAIQAVERDCPDLVLMDIALAGDMDGITAAGIIRERHDLPVVFITTFIDSKLLAQAQKCGAFGYVIKPFDRATVLSAIELAVHRHGLEMRLRASEERFRIFAEYTHDWEYWLAPNGEPIYHSPSCLRMTGYQAEEFMARPGLLTEIVHPEDAEMVAQHRHHGHSGNQCAMAIDFRIVTRAGEERWLNHVCQPVYAADGRFEGTRAGNRNITTRKKLEVELQRMAIHDALTGLPNRKLLGDRLALAVAGARRRKGKMAVLFIDLDNFKPINDNFGHKVGDQVLKAVASRISQHIRRSDTLARYGGDEFVIVLCDLPETEAAWIVARKALETFAPPVEVEGRAISLRASIGIATFPEHGATPEALLDRADAAMYSAKLAGGGRILLVPPAQERPVVCIGNESDFLNLEHD